MLSRLLSGEYRMAARGSAEFILKHRPQALRLPIVQKRIYSDLIPPSQYDEPWPKKFNLIYALKNYWELIPLATCTAIAIFGVIFNLIWAAFNKVDVVFTSNSRNNISRTMNLRCPTIHKMITINQSYVPWPAMQDALDKVDVMFLSRNEGNISRTMNLRDPSVHKLITIYQRYTPWPEMQDSVDAMRAAERRWRARMRQRDCLTKANYELILPKKH